MLSVDSYRGILDGWLFRWGSPAPFQVGVLRLSGKLCRGSRVVIAKTAVSRKVGLKNHSSLESRQGLLYPKTKKLSTEGNRFPIDIVWVDKESTITRIDRGVLPIKACVRGPSGADSALLLAVGSAEKMAMKVGLGVSLVLY